MAGRELTDPLLAARRIITELRIREPAEILIEEIAFTYGAFVREDALAGADGRLVRFGDRGVIRVKADIPEAGRRRFVIAHELGHFMLRHGVDIVKLCGEEDLLEWAKGQRLYENDANEFAAELLMPEEFFRPRCRSPKPNLQAIERLAAEFQTSLTATAIRYAEFSGERCAVVVSQQGRIRWNRGCSDFPYWLLRRGELHGYSYAIDCVEGKPTPDYISQVSATAWLPGLKHHAERTVWEQSRVISRRLGVVLSLLWLPHGDDE